MADTRLEGFPEGLRISASDWPQSAGEFKPGDLRYFVPQGFGLGAPLIFTPYGGPPDGSYYGLQEPQLHPMLNAPLTDAEGGTLYFDGDIADDALAVMLGVVGIHDGARTYAAFVAHSENPPKERFLDQLRLIQAGALEALFRAKPDAPLAEQSLTMGEAIAAFVKCQREKWNRGGYAFPSALAGTAGGDGDWAKESLAFGLAVENTYWGVYRVWSRPWLVTK